MDNVTTNGHDEVMPRNLRFPPQAEDAKGTVAVSFEIDNESHSGALLKLRINRGEEISVTPAGKAPCKAKIARVVQTDDGVLHLGITWEGSGIMIGE